MLIDLINKHIDRKFHIDSILHNDFEWVINTTTYVSRDKELINALWKAFVWCYDDTERKKKEAEEAAVWKSPDELVEVRGGSHG